MNNTKTKKSSHTHSSKKTVSAHNVTNVHHSTSSNTHNADSMIHHKNDKNDDSDDNNFPTHKHIWGNNPNMILGIFSIISIVLIVVFTNMYVPVTDNTDGTQTDSIGMASGIVTENSNQKVCKLVVGKTTDYGDTTLAITLGIGESVYYSGLIVYVTDINADGCVIAVNEYSEYIINGQMQQVGPFYITIREILE